MDSSTYQNQCHVTDLPDYQVMRDRLQDETVLRLLHALMGMTTEVGEAMDVLKKFLIYGKPIDFLNLKEEGGDSLWYHAILFLALDTDFQTEMARNIAKLRVRYGDKFTDQGALERNLDKERAVLEKEF